jgi:hypothetical protein
VFPTDLLGCRQSVPSGHGHIQQHDVWT